MPTYTLLKDRITSSHVEYPAGVKPASPHVLGYQPLGKYWDGTELQDNPPLATQKDRLKSENLRRIISRLDEGFNYTFPGGVDDVIQTRDQTDLGNVNAVSTTAIVLQSQGITDPVLSFRAQSNTTHALTPEQAIAMGIAVSNFVSSVYGNKWRVDDEVIDAATTQVEIDAIDLDVEWS